ncbi:hypothetical protein SAMN05428988_5817 [Chitinophaga sp. YR573]|uniref:hypothetical protein n=1 Tax=Chitinophaga sp. YR573 TaxID=1881040 RepID=UPI0008D356C8|nr:hypothetical protein [Chitinophaga sp. YR573]SEW44626.1 hypothetical protein SAMN05428988_5817 [Chitinophaga sp. YR573]
MYNLTTSTALMKNQKAAQVLSDQSLFSVLQNSQGQSLFFSIGDDAILYLSAEQDNATTGWTPIDLTTELAADYTGKTVTAKTFVVSQDATTGDILILQAIHVAEDNADYLYMLSGLSNAPDAAWLTASSNRSWTARLYDDTADPVSNTDIAYINIALNQDPIQAPYVIVGLQDQATTFIQNYVVSIDPTTTTGIWTKYETAENYDQLYGMAIGKAQAAMFAGLYELYTLNDNTSLTFTPLKSVFGPPDIIKLTPPDGATAIATMPPDSSGNTNLYVAGTGAIYLFSPDQQLNDATGTAVITNDLIVGVEYFKVHQSGNQVTLWGKDNEGTVFYSRCDVDNQTDPGSWSCPLPLLVQVEQLASLLDIQTQSSVLYAHTTGQSLVKLIQDAVTTQWSSQSILLPALSTSDIYEYYAFTTTLKVTDDNNLPIGGQAVQITATSPCSLYMDNQYVTLLPDVPLTVTSDSTGMITFVQETQTLGAVCYNFQQDDNSWLNVNPMNNIVQSMSGITQGSDLTAVNVTDEYGTTTPLVPSTIPADQADAVAKGIAQFVSTAQTLPQDGSLQSTGSFAASEGLVWGLSFANNSIQYFEGSSQYAAAGIIPASDIGNAIEAFAGDIFKWLENAVDEVAQFVVKVIDGVTHFFIEIGDAVYHFIMQCINDVVHGIQFILSKIEAGFEKLVQWVGFIFSWSDIIRTHNVLKNIFAQYSQYCVDNISSYKQTLLDTLSTINEEIDQWANIPAVSDTIAGSNASSPSMPGKDSPQSHWALYHTKGNVAGASTTFDASFDGDALSLIIADLCTALENEEQNFEDVLAALKTDVIDQIGTLSASELITNLLGIIANLLIDTVGNIIGTVMDIIAALVAGVVEALTTPLDIPVISYIYNKFTGNDLTLLDLTCLIVSIPVTIIYKLIKEATPFPDDSFTQSLIAATDYTTIQNLYAGASSLAVADDDGVTPVQIITLTLAISGYFGSIAMIIMTAVKAAAPQSAAVCTVYALAYLPYIAPNIAITKPSTQKWYVDMDEIITVISVIKTFSDITLYKYDKNDPEASQTLAKWAKASPYVELLINVIWEIPTIGFIADNQDAGTVLGFLGNTSFNVSGILSPWSDTDYVMLGIVIFIGLYGEMMLVQGMVNFPAPSSAKYLATKEA